MKIKTSLVGRALALALAGTFACGTAWAEKPSWAGEKGGGRGEKGGDRGEKGGDRGEKGGDRGQKGDRDRDGPRESKREHFGDNHRTAVRDYYGGEFQSGRRCPPGLAKKNNGCMPPGQAKKWEMGRPLQRDVIYYEVPAPLVVQLGVPPQGYKYVRVAGDILMIAVGSAMVVDAIRDLGR